MSKPVCGVLDHIYSVPLYTYFPMSILKQAIYVPNHHKRNWYMRLAKPQISLCIRPVLLESSLRI